MSDSLARLADRTAIDPHFLAFCLAEYAKAGPLDRAGLIAALGIPADRFPHLQLCPTPRADPAGFREDVEHLATTFGANRNLLLEIVRHGQIVAAQQAEPAEDPNSAGYLLAARDRSQP